MPKYYCEYCDIQLTHSSPPGRRQHGMGRKHINAKIDYYTELLRDPTYQPPDYLDFSQTAAGRNIGLSSGGGPTILRPPPNAPQIIYGSPGGPRSGAHRVPIPPAPPPTVFVPGVNRPAGMNGGMGTMYVGNNQVPLGAPMPQGMHGVVPQEMPGGPVMMSGGYGVAPPPPPVPHGMVNILPPGHHPPPDVRGAPDGGVGTAGMHPFTVNSHGSDKFQGEKMPWTRWEE